MILGGNLQHGWRWRSVRIDHVTDHFRVVLVDQDDVDVVTLDEALEAILDLADGGVWRLVLIRMLKQEEQFRQSD